MHTLVVAAILARRIPDTQGIGYLEADLVPVSGPLVPSTRALDRPVDGVGRNADEYRPDPAAFQYQVLTNIARSSSSATRCVFLSNLSPMTRPSEAAL